MTALTTWLRVHHMPYVVTTSARAHRAYLHLHLACSASHHLTAWATFAHHAVLYCYR
jgi:hypothetical protein